MMVVESVGPKYPILFQLGWDLLIVNAIAFHVIFYSSNIHFLYVPCMRALLCFSTHLLRFVLNLSPVSMFIIYPFLKKIKILIIILLYYKLSLLAGCR